MHPFQDRVYDERQQLSEKIEKLIAFIDGDSFTSLSKVDQVLLQQQLGLMISYDGTLRERIQRFVVPS